MRIDLRINNKWTNKQQTENLFTSNAYLYNQEQKKAEDIVMNYDQVHWCNKKSLLVVVAFTVEPVSFGFCWISFGFFITVTKPPNSSNRNGVALLLAQINYEIKQYGGCALLLFSQSVHLLQHDHEIWFADEYFHYLLNQEWQPEQGKKRTFSFVEKKTFPNCFD